MVILPLGQLLPLATCGSLGSFSLNHARASADNFSWPNCPGHQDSFSEEKSMRKSQVMLTALTLAAGVIVGAASVALTAERHPQIHDAQADLARAKAHLEQAAHDYAGHRVAAIERIDQAQNELKLALIADTH
jgi:hypothetical protein